VVRARPRAVTLLAIPLWPALWSSAVHLGLAIAAAALAMRADIWPVASPLTRKPWSGPHGSFAMLWPAFSVAHVTVMRRTAMLHLWSFVLISVTWCAGLSVVTRSPVMRISAVRFSMPW
jgi:hypothetical protein